MDFELDALQNAILDGIDGVLRRHAGGDNRQLPGDTDYDSALDDAIAQAGYRAGESELSPLEAALVVMRVARTGASIPVAAHILVGPLVLGRRFARPLALLGERGTPVRFGAVARNGLILEADGAHLLTLDPAGCRPVRHAWSPATARVSIVDDEVLDAGCAERFRDWWQVGIAAEAVGLLDGALARTLDHLRSREQFGRPIGSFQAVQHRLAELSVAHEGARWLTCEAAWLGAPPLAAATACAAAMTAAEQAVRELHQVSGATGLTNEYGLHRFTFPLVALRAETGGLGAQHRRVAAARWSRIPEGAIR
jgi:hypothetical protein